MERRTGAFANGGGGTSSSDLGSTQTSVDVIRAPRVMVLVMRVLAVMAIVVMVAMRLPCSHAPRVLQCQPVGVCVGSCVRALCRTGVCHVCLMYCGCTRYAAYGLQCEGSAA